VVLLWAFVVRVKRAQAGIRADATVPVSPWNTRRFRRPAAAPPESLGAQILTITAVAGPLVPRLRDAGAGRGVDFEPKMGFVYGRRGAPARAPRGRGLARNNEAERREAPDALSPRDTILSSVRSRARAGPAGDDDDPPAAIRPNFQQFTPKGEKR